MAAIEALHNALQAAIATDSPDGALISEVELRDAWATAQQPSIDGAPVRTQRNWLSAFLIAIGDSFRELFSGGNAVTETFNSDDLRREWGAQLARAHAGDIMRSDYRSALEAEIAKQLIAAQKVAGEPIDADTAQAYAKDVVDGFDAEARRLSAAGALPRGPFLTKEEGDLLRDLKDADLTADAKKLRTQILAGPGFPAPASTGVSLRRPRPQPLGPPQELLDLQTRQFSAHPAPTPADEADDHFRDKRWTGRYLKRAGSLPSELSEMASHRDAARVMIVAENADLWVLRYAYTTHKPMEVWVQNGPADGKMRVSAIATPSSHNGDANYQLWARTNRYRVEVRYPDGTVTSTEFGVKNPPEYASASDPFVIDLSKKGDIVVSGWPIGTSAYGYIEARQLVIHNK